MSCHVAEAPKRSMPMVRPSRPVIRSQPSVAPASSDTRGMPSPSTSARYASSWAKNASQHGRLTTRTDRPRPASSSAAASATHTSEPVATSTTSWPSRST